MQRDFEQYFRNDPLGAMTPGDGDGPAGHWSVPWADLMMVMFVLFVVLYIFAVRHKDVVVLFSQRTAPGEARGQVDRLDGLITRIAGRNGNEGMPVEERREVYYKSTANGVSVVREEQQVRVTLRGGLFFKSGGTELQVDAKEYLSDVAEIIRLTQGGVEVIGYADAKEADGVQGFKLTAERASNVARWFIEEGGIAPSRFSVAGRGGYVPELPSISPGHEDANRRVEIIIHTGS
ncbi:OmpA/MotB family protein [Paucidesulfovibrio longus]|uniref:OmpA/MotB family protein n=1 Tax=Paucidesulfovibrio longus TaxID=889 RepID=UPI0003B71846|nr:OmpA family protein [Paucidesulfovibrio longus]